MLFSIISIFCFDDSIDLILADGSTFDYIIIQVHSSQVGCFLISKLVSKGFKEIIYNIEILYRQLLTDRLGCALLFERLLSSIFGPVFFRVAPQVYFI